MAVRLELTLFWYRPHCFYCANQVVLMLSSLHLHEKSREVCIKARSNSSLACIHGQVTKHTTVKWPIKAGLVLLQVLMMYRLISQEYSLWFDQRVVQSSLALWAPSYYPCSKLKKIQIVPISKAGQPKPWIWLPWWILCCPVENTGKCLAEAKLLLTLHCRTLTKQNRHIGQVLFMVNLFSIFGWVVRCFSRTTSLLVLLKIGYPVNFLVVSDDWTTTNFKHCIMDACYYWQNFDPWRKLNRGLTGNDSHYYMDSCYYGIMDSFVVQRWQFYSFDSQ